VFEWNDESDPCYSQLVSCYADSDSVASKPSKQSGSPSSKMKVVKSTNQTEGTMRDYNGKTVYVGIDVHKKTYSCVATCNGEVVKRDTMPGKPEVVVAYLKKAFSGAKIESVYEAGFSGFNLHRILHSEGINNAVVNAASIEISSRDRVKTDKRDALKMSTQLSVGRLSGIHVPSTEREQMRSVSRLRDRMMRTRNSIGNQLKALLHTQGLIGCEDDVVISKKWIAVKLEEIKRAHFIEDFIFTVEQYQDEWIQLNNRITEITKRMKTQAKQDAGLQALYKSVPGIGDIHSRQLINELGDMKQFKNERRLFSFTGLTPCEYSSGENVRHGKISRQGNPMLRKILVESAWAALKKDPELKETFSRIAHRRGKKRAIVAIARKLVGRIRSCVLSGSLYEKKIIKEACSLQNGLHDPARDAVMR
jgi:Transposase and inactivated derivatives